jgi:intracellular multiplication protein IcmD
MHKIVSKIVNQPIKQVAVLLMCFGLAIFSAEAAALTIGGMASNMTHTFEAITKLLTAGSYIAGIAFSIGALMKFKQHKDNPQSVPIGTPVSLIFIAAALLFLPSILSVTGESLFGKGASTSGPSGTVPR